MSMNKDNSHSWVRISHGSNKFVTNSNDNEQETSEVQFKECALKLDAKDFACRSKAKAKPQRREPADPSTRTIPTGKRTWTDVEPGEYKLSDYAMSKKLIHLLRHARIHREDDGQGDGVPKACRQQAAADSRGSRTCVCASTLLIVRGGTRRGRKDELTSCRGTV